MGRHGGSMRGSRPGWHWRRFGGTEDGLRDREALPGLPESGDYMEEAIVSLRSYF